MKKRRVIRRFSVVGLPSQESSAGNYWAKMATQHLEEKGLHLGNNGIVMDKKGQPVELSSEFSRQLRSWGCSVTAQTITL